MHPRMCIGQLRLHALLELELLLQVGALQKLQWPMRLRHSLMPALGLHPLHFVVFDVTALLVLTQ